VRRVFLSVSTKFCEDVERYAPRDDLRQDATVPDWLEIL
jgi:hypothetical protein